MKISAPDPAKNPGSGNPAFLLAKKMQPEPPYKKLAPALGSGSALKVAAPGGSGSATLFNKIYFYNFLVGKTKQKCQMKGVLN